MCNVVFFVVRFTSTQIKLNSWANNGFVSIDSTKINRISESVLLANLKNLQTFANTRQVKQMSKTDFDLILKIKVETVSSFVYRKKLF